MTDHSPGPRSSPPHISNKDWELAPPDPMKSTIEPTFAFGIQVESCFGLVSPLQYWLGVFSSTRLSKIANSTFAQQPNQRFPDVA